MRIGIDYRLPASASQRGSARTFREIIAALVNSDTGNEYILYANIMPASDKIKNKPNFTIRIIKEINYIIDEQVRFPRLVRQDALDILWCPYNTFPLLITRKCRLIVTIHDLIFLNAPSGKESLRQKIGRLYRKLCVTAGRKRIDTCITVSQYSANQIRLILGINSVCIPNYNCVGMFSRLVGKYSFK